MATYSRTIGGIASALPPPPVWRQNMSQARTVYAVGPASVNNALRPLAASPPGGVVPPRFYDVREDARIHLGWNGSCYVPDAGFAGKLVYFAAGENYWGNAASAFDLQSGQWEWWQDNYFCTSLEQAIAEDADAYYSPTDAARLPANRQFTETTEAYAAWDKGFPVAHQGWVYRRKFTSHSHGRNRHWAGRYNTVSTIPKEMTGTGRSAIVINGHSWRGPFSQGPSPSGYRPYGDWYDKVDSLGEGLSYVFWQDPVTREWSRLAKTVPGVNRAGVYQQASVVDSAYKRVYYVCWEPQAAVYYADFSNGAANATMSALFPLTTVGPANIAIGDHTSVTFTDGHPQGRRLVYFRAEPLSEDASNRLMMIDLDTNKLYPLGPIPGLDMDRTGMTRAHCGLGYIAERNMLVLTTKTLDRGGMLMHLIQIPSDPTVASGYQAQTVSLPLASGVTLEPHPLGDVNIFMYGQGKGGYIPSLGVVMTTQVNGPLLAYRPF